MANQNEKISNHPVSESVIVQNGRVVSFKEGYLDNLVEAEALLEVVGKMVACHDDMHMNQKTYMGMSILLEKITRLIDVNSNMVNDDTLGAEQLASNT